MHEDYLRIIGEKKVKISWISRQKNAAVIGFQNVLAKAFVREGCFEEMWCAVRDDGTLVITLELKQRQREIFRMLENFTCSRLEAARANIFQGVRRWFSSYLRAAGPTGLIVPGAFAILCIPSCK